MVMPAGYGRWWGLGGPATIFIADERSRKNSWADAAENFKREERMIFAAKPHPAKQHHCRP
jgi:hypothetical protein